MGGPPWALRSPAAGELESVVSCVEAGFGVAYTSEQRARFCAALELDRALVAVVDGTVVGTLASHVLEQTVVGPVVVPCVAVTDVTVLPAYRRRGIFDDLMRRFLCRAHERGDVLAVLAASTADLYGRYGFGVATWSQSGRLRLSSTRRSSSAVPVGRAAQVPDVSVVTLQIDEALEALPEIFEAVRGTRPGELSRPLALYEELFDELSPKERRTVVAVVIDGLIDGYAIYDCAEPTTCAPDARVQVVELTAASPAARQRLWEHLCACGAAELEFEQLAPGEIDVAAHRSGGRPEVTTTDRTWNRLIDAAAALRLRRYRGPGELVLDIDDELCSWNDGRYLLAVDDADGATVVPTRRTADLALGAGALATLYSGSSSTLHLAASGEVVEQTSGALARADRLFSSAVTPFCTGLC